MKWKLVAPLTYFPVIILVLRGTGINGFRAMQLHKAAYEIVIIVEDETYEKIVLAAQRAKFSATL